MSLKLLAAGSGVVVLAWILSVFNNVLGSTPYMDEIFHIPQAQAYCEFPGLGNVGHDPKITTFPGVYWISALAYALFRIVTGSSPQNIGGECSAEFLRSVNVALGCVGMGLVHGIVSHVRAHAGSPVKPDDDIIDTALATAFPLHAFFMFLYYTDTASTVFVLATWMALMKRRYALSGIFAGCSILMRQTNAVWVVCLVGWDVAEAAIEGRAGQDKRERQVSKNAVWSQSASILRYIRTNMILQVQRYGLHAGSVLAFAAFVVWNGGIVLGDKENHAPVRHWAQPFYFYAFFVISTAPMWLSRGQIGPLERDRLRRWPSLLALLAVTLLTFLAIHRGTLVHPFILADNRHYTFYLWRRLIGASPWSRYYAIPGYAAAVWLVLFSRGDRFPVKTAILVLCTASVLVPAHLVEFRYFTIPWYLHLLRPGSVLYESSRRAALLKLLTLFGYLLLNAATMHLFLNKSFRWSDGSVARFMW